MRFGIIWFLHLDKLLQSFKFFIIPFFILGFVTTVGSPIFLASWALFGICGLLALFTLFIRPPSSARMEAFITKYETEIKEKRANEFRKYSQVEVQTLTCFSNANNIKLTHALGRNVVHTRLVMLAFVRTKDELWLVVDEKSLLSKRPAETKRYRIENVKEIKFDQTPVDEDEMNLVIQVQNDTLNLFVRSDYHMREFISRFQA
ncbi:MAG: hypothetical protein IKJ35_04775 [Clostridia bacterium]|nr:hypothetical protein [Clostridia bacterium]